MNNYGGFDLFLTYSPADNKKVVIRTDIVGIAQYVFTVSDWWLDSRAGNISFSIRSQVVDGKTKIICQTIIGNSLVDVSDWDMECSNISSLKCRFVMGNDSFSIYCNGIWVYTYVLAGTYWPEIPHVYIKAVGTEISFSDICHVELSDPREAVFVDYELTADSAIQSIIQQRPIQIFAEVERASSFAYSPIKDTVNAHHISSYRETTQDGQGLSSDGLVYYLDVAVSISQETAEQIGLITRLYRLSDLSNGAQNAASRLQKLALQRRKMIYIGMRSDPRLEVADELIVDTVVSGTQRHVVDDVIIEDISLAIRDGSYTMNIVARRK